MLTTDAKAPDLNAKGNVSLESLNLAPIVKDPAQKSDITGSARFDVRLAGNPTPPAAALDRLSGHVAFDGPKVTAAGYTASNVKAAADIKGRHIRLDTRANAYGGSATAKGSLTIAGPTGQPFLLDLAGSASRINLANLPRTINAPRITTNLNASAYHVKGSVRPQDVRGRKRHAGAVHARRRHDHDRHVRRVHARVNDRKSWSRQPDLRRARRSPRSEPEERRRGFPDRRTCEA